MVITSLADKTSRKNFKSVSEGAVIYLRRFLLKDPNNNDLWSRIHGAKINLFGGNGDSLYDINRKLKQMETPQSLMDDNNANIISLKVDYEDWIGKNFYLINLATMTHYMEANEFQMALDFDVNSHVLTYDYDELQHYRSRKFDDLIGTLETAASAAHGQVQQPLVNQIKDAWGEFLIYALTQTSIAWSPDFVEDLESEVEDLESEVEDLESEVEDLESEVEDLESEIQIQGLSIGTNEQTPADLYDELDREPGKRAPKNNYPSARAPRQNKLPYVKWKTEQVEFIGQRLMVYKYQSNRYQVILQEGIDNGLFDATVVTVNRLDARARMEWRRRPTNELGGFVYARVSTFPVLSII